MSDVVEQIMDAVKEIAHDVTDKVGAAVKDALHVPDNFAPMLATMKELVTTGQKFAAGEGSKEELAKLTEKLGSFSAMVDGLENGPLKKMVMGLRDQALAQLKDVKGAEKIVKILAVLGEKDDGNATAASGGAAEPVVAAEPAAPAVAEVAPAVAAVLEPSA